MVNNKSPNMPMNEKETKIVTYSSNKTLRFVISLLILLSPTQVGVVDCRTLSSPQVMSRTAVSVSITTVTGCSEKVQPEVRWRVKEELAHKMASGPSKRGPGH
ncbi:hypothetical protein SSX86_001840 [Deinandra increscens subsp. villosa]|uniref:Uncharacterized protein n=1 Tax=Deinandra increscens subsp. villosa TaxID=3103831 RepID=A0AAP0DVL5_9ASTR